MNQVLPEGSEPSQALPAAATLAITLRRLRRERGLSMREMVAPLHLAAHSAVADFESGRRLPAPDILLAYERHFAVQVGTLLALRQQALIQRAAGDARRTAAHAARAADLITGHRPVPAQLPHTAGTLVGRQPQMRRLRHLACGTDPAAVSPTVVICSIDGIAGVGKTALAVHFARTVSDEFPDGQLYIDLRGHSAHASPMSAMEALRRLLRAFGVDTANLPVEVDELSAHYRTVLHDRRVLIVLDNAADTRQIRPLLPGHPGSLAIVTSRNSMSGLVARDGAQRTMLGVLAPDESLDLLAQVLGPARIAAAPEAAADIARLCGHLPLALRIAAERAIARPDAPLAAFATELSDEQTVLSHLVTGDDETTNVRAAFSWSYRSLPAGPARLFRCLAVHPGDRFGVDAVAALAGIDVIDAAAALHALVSAHLVEAHDATRYRMHDLLRAYARERLSAEEPVDERREITSRIAGWYLHSAQAAARRLRPRRRHTDLGTAPGGTVPLTFSDYDAALAWLDDEHPTCTAAATAAHHAGLDTLAAAFPGTLYDIFELRGLIEEWDSTIQVALASARRIDDRATTATLLSNLAVNRRRAGRAEEALTLLHESLALRREIGDRQGQAATLGNIANVINRMSRPDEAIPLLRESLALYREIGSPLGVAMMLGNLGIVYGEQRHIPEMIDTSREALSLFRELEDRPGEARTLSVLAYAYGEIHESQQAIDYASQALELSRACGARDIEAAALRYAAAAWFEQGEPALAESFWRRSLAIYEELADPFAAEVRAELDRLDG